MKLLFKQRFLSWLDSYDIYGEDGAPIYEVKGKLGWGHCLKIYDPQGSELGMVKERITFLYPKFDLFIGEKNIGCVTKEITWFKPRFTVDCNGWTVEGDWAEWDYTIRDGAGGTVAKVQKEIWNWTDTYTINVENPAQALPVLMMVLAIDAEKCSRS